MFWVLKRTILMRQFFKYPKHRLWLANGKNSLNLDARVHIYRTGKTTTKPAKTTTGIYIRIPSDGLLMTLPDETNRGDLPSSKILYWPFQGGTSFVDLLCFCSVLCLLCFVRVCLYVLCGHLLGKGWPLGSRLWCLLWVCHFPIGILGQVWYLIVSIPDLCNLTYFVDVD